LEPVLLELLQEGDWRVVEERIGEAALLLLQGQNRLGITPRIGIGMEKAKDEPDGMKRHHMSYNFWGIGQRIASTIRPPLRSLMENQVFWLDERSLILWNEEVGKWSLHLQK
jgi:hypothetical protein